MSRGMSDTRELNREETVPPTSHPYAVSGSASDRLHRLLCAAPLEQGPLPVARHLVDGFAQILPTIAFGIAPSRCCAESELVTSRHSKPAWSDPGPARLFPDMPHERALPLTGELGGCLHCGSEDPALDDDDSPLVHVLRSCAETVSFGMRAAGRRAPLRSEEALHSSLVQTEKLASLGEIAAGVVHELSNPLTSIATYSEYLLRKAGRSNMDPEDVERLRRIAQASDRILKFTRALVSYARPADETPGPVDLHDVVDKSLVFCEHVIHECGVQVRCDVSDELPLVRGVSGQLIQVFVNLVTNACQAMADGGGTLFIDARLAGSGQVNVTLRDTGPGIRGEHLPHIFEPFFTTKDKSKGSGLGLSIVRFIVAGHGGDVAADSPGCGAVFTVRLPSIPPESGSSE